MFLYVELRSLYVVIGPSTSASRIHKQNKVFLKLDSEHGGW